MPVSHLKAIRRSGDIKMSRHKYRNGVVVLHQITEISIAGRDAFNDATHLTHLTAQGTTIAAVLFVCPNV